MLQIHERIKNERIKAGLTEDEVAEKLGIGRSTYQYWEKKTPAFDKIKQVAEALGLPENYFFVNNDEKDVSRSTDSETGQTMPEKQVVTNTLAEALAIIKQQNEFLQRLVDTSLAEISTDVNNNAAAIRAEIRGYAQRQILKEVNNNDEAFLKAKAEADKIYLLNLKQLLAGNTGNAHT